MNTFDDSLPPAPDAPDLLIDVNNQIPRRRTVSKTADDGLDPEVQLDLAHDAGRALDDLLKGANRSELEARP